MKIRHQQSFTSQFSMVTKTQNKLIKDAMELFADYPMHESLRNHPLQGKWAKYRSISADKDLRIHYRVLSETEVLFVALGSHKELYK